MMNSSLSKPAKSCGSFALYDNYATHSSACERLHLYLYSSKVFFFFFLVGKSEQVSNIILFSRSFV